MTRNKNIDLIRALAVLFVLIYHIYAITNVSFGNNIADTYLIYGGVVGVCVFFILSGFGIYNSFEKSASRGEKFSYNKYLKRRFLRIAPQYYFSIIVVLLFTTNAIYLNKDQLLNIFSHIFFFHNFFYTMAGAINGVCWTLAVTVQFYLIAPFIYKIFKKSPKIVLISSYIVSLILKYIVFHYIIAPSGDTNTFLYFNYGNQIFTTLEFFVSGMFIAYLTNKTKEEEKKNNILNITISIVFFALLYFVLKLATEFSIPFITNTGIYSDCTMAYIWHTLIAIILTVIIYYFSKIKFNFKSMLSKLLLFVSKYEYGIYIWHLLIITNLNTYSPFFKGLLEKNFVILYLAYLIISISVGFVMSKFIDDYDYSKIDYSVVKKISKILFYLSIVFALYKSVLLIQPIINSVSLYANTEIVDNNTTNLMAEKVKSRIDINNNCKYIYLDTEETGYLYFFQLRYYLSPCESVHYNQYVYTSNYGTEEDFYKFLKEQDVNYVLIKDNEMLSKAMGTNFDSENLSIYKINNKSTNLKNILIPLEE